MNCPNCGVPYEEGDVFCRFCGNPLVKKLKKKKGTLLVPMIILAALSIAGLVMYFVHPLPAMERDTPWFTLEDGVLYFDPYLYEGSEELTVPATIGGKPVLELSRSCFAGISEITTVHLPDSLQAIGDYAFSDCISLRGIEIPEGVTEIGRSAFQNCASLEAITVPSTVQKIGEDAFAGCESLKHIFYDGEFRTWESLYQDHINLYTHVYCTDGDHLHR